MPRKVSNLNWFQQHLNGTTVLAILLGFTIIGFGSLEALETVVGGLGSLFFRIFENTFDNRELVHILVGLVVCLPVLGWTIKQKKRSLWWILITLIPFGWIGFLFLSDKELNKAKERMEQLQAKIIDLNNSPRSVKHWDMVISDAKSLGLELPFSNAKSAVKKLQQDIDDLEKELKELREKYPQLVLEVKPSTNRWGRARQALCCVGIIAVVVVMVFAANYDLPVIGEYSELVFPEATRSAGLLRVEIKDYSNASLWVRIGSEHNLIPAYLGVFLLYGALKK